MWNKRLLIFPFILSILKLKCEKLTEKENQKRLEECGREMLDIPSKNTSMAYPRGKFLVIVSAIQKINNELTLLPGQSLGTFISPRHILTSSQPLINDDGLWMADDSEVDETDYVEGTSHLKVPDEEIGYLVVRISEKMEMDDEDELPVRSAWILNSRDQSDITNMRSPMIIELDTDYPDIKYPCVVKEHQHIPLNTPTHIYGISDRDTDILDYRQLPIFSISADQRWLLVPQYFAKNDRGGPMIRYDGTLVTVLGIAASPPVDFCGQDINCESTFFFNMKRMANATCFLAGICEKELDTGTRSTTSNPTTPKITRKPTLTSNTTPRSSLATRTAKLPLSSPSKQHGASTTLIPKMKPMKLDDQEEEVDDDYYKKDDVNWDYTHIQVSADFIKIARNLEMNFVMVVVVFAIFLSYH